MFWIGRTSTTATGHRIQDWLTASYPKRRAQKHHNFVTASPKTHRCRAEARAAPLPRRTFRSSSCSFARARCPAARRNRRSFTRSPPARPTTRPTRRYRRQSRGVAATRHVGVRVRPPPRVKRAEHNLAVGLSARTTVVPSARAEAPQPLLHEAPMLVVGHLPHGSPTREARAMAPPAAGGRP